MSVPAPNDSEKELLDDDVEGALYRIAIGAHVDLKEASGDGTKKKTRAVRKELAPNLGAIKFILTNRRPAKWRTKPAEPEPEETIIRTHPVVRKRETGNDH